ncbi:hypothetical protein M404DRAFT_194895 [Pisolithus tinctorius Marx 270]|uniref:Uncharacterized protein n=1 Tax=Pisolithus tinctorius Marx 270 TaxID=870435 RepID=A0A0C3PZP6_PISTI|nr:hypothetical protein M404DRAFT_194895 [Pisolithus tinctorius Marx 270]
MPYFIPDHWPTRIPFGQFGGQIHIPNAAPHHRRARGVTNEQAALAWRGDYY